MRAAYVETAMQKLIGQQVKVTAGKYAGQQGKLLSIAYEEGHEEAEVKVKHKSWLGFFHFIKTITVKPSELAPA